MSEILQDLSAPALATAFEANVVELFSLFRQWRRAEVYFGPDMLWTMTDIPASIFNSIIRAQLSPDSVDTAIEAAILRSKARNVPISWWAGPATRPAELGASLKVHGFVQEEDNPEMAIDLSVLNTDVPTPPGLVVEQVTEIETLRKWRHAFATGFGMPDFMGDAFFELFATVGFDAHSPLHNYIGWLNGEPVATSTLFLAAGVAGIYDIATVPEVRNRGIGAALTSMPLREARTMGYRVGVLEASTKGASVYRGLGFQEYGRIGHYVWASEHANQGAG